MPASAAESSSGRRAGAPRRRRASGLALACGVIVLLWLGGRLAFLCDPTARILARHGQLAGVAEEPPSRERGHVDQAVQLRSTSGLEVELCLRRPDDGGTTPRPAVLILGGHRTGRDAARLVPHTHGIVVAALSYPTTVERIEGFGDALAVRRAILDTPAAVMLGLDYLCVRPFVDPARVELLGVSLGAPFACVAGSLDPRFRRVWSIHGGGAPARLLGHALRRELAPAPLRRLAGWSIALLSHGLTLAPEDWVGRIAPRPFVMVNGRDDPEIPRDCVDLLFAAAREPKELVWIPGGHIDRHREEDVLALVELVLERMQ